MAGDDTTGARPTVEQLEQLLISGTDEDCHLYCIMDGFWADGLYGRLLNSSDLSWAHLFQGDVATRRVQQAPFIIALKRGHHLTRWLLEKGWGQGWGIYFTVSTRTAKRHYGTPPIHDKRFLPSNEEDIKLGNLLGGREDALWAIRRHFRQFSDVILEDNGKIVDFRYYDPDALRVYIAGCRESERQRFFGPVRDFYSEWIDVDYRKRNLFALGHYHRKVLDDTVIGYVLDLQTNQQQPIILLPSHMEGEARNISVYQMIRNSHYQEFEKQQSEKFLHKMAYALSAQMQGTANIRMVYYDTYQRIKAILPKINWQQHSELHVAALIVIHFFDLRQKFSLLPEREQGEIMNHFSLADLQHSLRKLT